MNWVESPSPRTDFQRRREADGSCSSEVQTKKIRTCYDLFRYQGTNKSGFYNLEVEEGRGVGDDSTPKKYFRVECIFNIEGNRTRSKTVIRHSALPHDFYFRKESQDKEILYESLPIGAVQNIISRSKMCQQYVKWSCDMNSEPFSNKTNLWWNENYSYKRATFGLTCGLRSSCTCEPQCDSERLVCSCSGSDLSRKIEPDFRPDDINSGFMIQKSFLPVRSLSLGLPPPFSQGVSEYIGPLECEGIDPAQLEIDRNRTDSKNGGGCSVAEPNPITALIVPHKKFVCQSGQVIDSIYRCIYEFDQYGYQIGCRDVTHLRSCDSFDCPYPNYVKCPDSYCIPPRYICDGKWDCIGGADEMGCAKYFCPGQYKCANSSACTLLQHLCDGIRHCPLGDDEWFCDLTCPNHCICEGLYVSCQNISLTQLPVGISKKVKKLDLSSNQLGPDLVNVEFSFYEELGELILQRNGIVTVSARRFLRLKNLYTLDLRFNQIQYIRSAAFAGLRRVTNLLLGGNPDLKVIEPEAFVGVSALLYLNISNTQIDVISENTFWGLTKLQSLEFRENGLEVRFIFW